MWDRGQSNEIQTGGLWPLLGFVSVFSSLLPEGYLWDSDGVLSPSFNRGHNSDSHAGGLCPLWSIGEFVFPPEG